MAFTPQYRKNSDVFSEKFDSGFEPSGYKRISKSCQKKETDIIKESESQR